jgi:ribosomal protein S26
VFNPGYTELAYIGGSTDSPAWIEFRDEFREWKGCRCEICYRGGSPKYKEEMEVHHIDCDPRNNNLDNLALLCHRCHSLLHHARIRLEHIPPGSLWTTKHVSHKVARENYPLLMEYYERDREIIDEGRPHLHRCDRCGHLIMDEKAIRKWRKVIERSVPIKEHIKWFEEKGNALLRVTKGCYCKGRCLFCGEEWKIYVKKGMLIEIPKEELESYL